MRISDWLPFDRMEELSFKHASGGWVFQAPNPWLFGPRRHYLVNESEKAELAAGLRRMWRSLLLAIIILCGVGLPAAMPLGLARHPLLAPVAGAAAGLVVGLVVVRHSLRRMRPVLAGLEPTAQRISQRDALCRQIAVFSRGHVVFYGLLSLALFLAMIAGPLFSPDGWDATSLLGTLLFGAASLYWLALYVAKWRRERARG